jgi:hypothetical protein
MSSDMVQAQQEALVKLTSNSDEDERALRQSILQAYHSNQFQVPAWVSVRVVEPRPLWEGPYIGSTQLKEYHDSYKRYAPQGTPRVVETKDFLALMQSNPRRRDILRFAQCQNYLRRQNLSWSVTVQEVLAERDPRQLEDQSSRSVWASIGSFFGHRIHYRLMEYRLTSDLFLTQIENQARALRRHHGRGGGGGDSEGKTRTLEKEKDTSSTKSLGITDSDSSGSSQRPLPATPPSEVIELPRLPSSGVNGGTGTLLKSTSSSSTTTATSAKQAFIPVMKSRSKRSTGGSASASVSETSETSLKGIQKGKGKEKEKEKENDKERHKEKKVKKPKKIEA